MHSSGDDEKLTDDVHFIELCLLLTSYVYVIIFRNLYFDFDYVRHHFILIALIFQCDGTGWLPLTGLPWFRTSLGSLHLWFHHSSRHQPCGGRCAKVISVSSVEKNTTDLLQ